MLILDFKLLRSKVKGKHCKEPKESAVKRCVNSRLKATKIKSQRKAFYRQRIPKSSYVRKETVDIDILVTSRDGDRKIMQSIRTSRPLSKIRKRN